MRARCFKTRRADSLKSSTRNAAQNRKTPKGVRSLKMPYAPAKPCSLPSCPDFRTPGSRYCATHAPQFAQQEQDRRGTATERGYSSRWARYRKWFLSQPENILCACGCGHAATDVDHIKPVSGPDDPMFWERTNHQPLTHACHSRKTAKDNGGFGNKKAT